MTMIRVFFSSLVFCWLISIVVCNHFYGGTITWQPVNPCVVGGPVSIMITQTYIWSYSMMPCTTSMIASNQFITNYLGLATKQLQCINNCVNGSAGYSNVNVISHCIGSSSGLGTSIGQRFDIITLTSGDDFSVAYQDNPWRNLVTSNNANWSLASHINLQPRSDNVTYNSAPLSNVISPIYIPATKGIYITITTVDPDGDIVRCRWADSSKGIDECGGVCPPSSLPSGTFLYPSCDIFIIAPTAFGEWYAIAIMIEDFINSSSTTPLSSIPVQFLVQIVAPPSCLYQPDIVTNLSTESCVTVIVGQPFILQLFAISYCGVNVSIVDIPIQAFFGVNESDVYQLNSTTYVKTIDWTPTPTQVGYQIMCTLAVDSENIQSQQYCFTFYVSINLLSSCPINLCPIVTTTTSTTSTTANTTVASAISVTDSISSTEPPEFILDKWLIIGSIAGVPLLLGLIVSSCLCCYYCSPCGVGRFQLSDCEGSFEFYHFDLDTEPKLNNRDYLDDNIDSTKDSTLDSSTSPAIPHRWVGPKPKRVTVISLPPSSSSQSILMDPETIFDYHRMNETPDYIRNIDNVHVRHFRRPKQWIGNEHGLSQFDSIN